MPTDFPPSAPTPAWRGSLSDRSAATGRTEPPWRQPVGTGGYRFRWRRLLLAGSGLLACAAALVWVALWMRPPEPARLVVVEAGYEDNLAVPINTTGRKAAQGLADFAREGSGSWFRGKGRLRFEGQPQELTNATVSAWSRSLDGGREDTVVLFLALHGGSDPEGAYLLPNDATADPRQRLRLAAVLDRLAALPAGRKKLLILDATQASANPAFGMLHNDFASALAELAPRIEAVPNLLVFSSSDVDQRSWASPEWGQTAFGHYLVQGVRGAADADRDLRLDAWELVRYVSEQVHAWARDQRGELQTPVLLPAGPEGERRARSMHLTLLHRSAPPAAEPPTPFEPPPELEQAWRRYRDLSATPPRPAAYEPHLWQEYRLALVRYEELLAADAAVWAERLRARVDELAARLEASRRLEIGPLTQTLALPAVAGVPPGRETPPAVAEALHRLEEATGPERSKVWQETRTAIDSLPSGRGRLDLCEALVTRTAEAPRRLTQTAGLVPLVTEGMPVRPAEVHFLAMAARDLPANPATLTEAPPVAEALRLRLRAERAAVGQEGREYPYAESVWPWAQTPAALADAERRQGEDLLFPSDGTSWQTARGHLTEANRLYGEGETAAASVRIALRARDRALTELPGYALWLAERRPPEDRPGRMATDAYLLRFADLWERAHGLNVRLNTAWTAGAPDRLPSPAELSALGAELDRDLRQLRESYLNGVAEALAAGLDSASADLDRPEAIRWLHETEALSRVPLPEDADPAMRASLLRERRRVSRQLLVLGTTRPEAQPEPSAAKTRERAWEAARRQGQLALASIGRSEFAALRVEGPAEDYDAVLHRLERFAGEAEGRNSLARAGAEIGARRQALTPAVQAANRRAELTALAEADRLARLLDGTTNGLLEGDPTAAYRQARVLRVLVAQARRTLADHWYSEGPTPYYTTAGLSLLANARKTGAVPTPEIAPLTQIVKDIEPTPLRVRGPDRVVITSERSRDVTFGLQPQAGLSGRPGFVTFAAEPDAKSAEAATGLQREARAVGAAEVPPVRVPVANPYFAGTTLQIPVTERATCRLHALFRGRRWATDAPVERHPLPEVVAYQTEGPNFASLALRTSPEIQEQFGEGRGALSIVLDCSGSMGPDPKKPDSRGRISEALDALEQVLRTLPPGCRLDVWAFGQRPAGRDARSAEDTIEQVVPPTVWKGPAGGQLPEIMGQLRGLQPWERSPVARTIIQAKRALDRVPAGFKTILVLTDGVDNRFAGDTAFNPQQKSIPEALRTEFAGSGVVVNVVAFRLRDRDEAAVQSQFRVVEALRPAGRFVTASDVGALAEALRAAMRQRIRYRLRSVDVGESAPPLPETDLTFSAGGEDLWYPRPLPPGIYEVSADVGGAVSQRIRLEAGDRLLARLRAVDGSLRFERVYYAAEAKALDRQPKFGQAEWCVADFQDQLSEGNRLQMLFGIEQKPEIGPELEVSRVGEAWVEIKAPREAGRFAARWGREPGYPAPTWGLTVRRWPSLAGLDALPAPAAEVWWQREAFPGQVVELGPGPVLNAANLERSAAGRKVVIESVRLERHAVEVRPGEMADRECLVVRLAHEPGEPVWVRPVGVDVDGYDYRFYRSADRVTCLFWRNGLPLNRDEVETSLGQLEVVTVSEFKAQAERAQRHRVLKDIPVPEAAYVRPALPVPVR